MKYLGLVTILCVVSMGVYFSSNSTIHVVNKDVFEDNQLQLVDDVVPAPSTTNSNHQNDLPSQLTHSSLKGTDIDGAYPVDEDGHLIPHLSIKKRFEYFLSTIGEYSLDQILGFIQQDLEANLSEPALSEAKALLASYIEFKRQLVAVEQSLSAPQDYELNDLARFKLQLDQMRAVRRSYLSEEVVTAFFGFDEMYDDYMLSRLEVQNNTQLTALEKQQQIESLENNLPEDIRITREQTQKVSNVYKLTEAMKSEGASEEEIHEVRQQAHGIEAAERLQALDNSRAKWQQRVNDYIAAKSQIEMDEQFSEDEKQQAIFNLQSESFSEQERMRLKAYELMAQESSN